MHYHEYQQRVIDEKTELDGRLEKLKAFVPTDKFKSLATDEQDRMILQSRAMGDYSEILRQRIAAFTA